MWPRGGGWEQCGRSRERAPQVGCSQPCPCQGGENKGPSFWSPRSCRSIQCAPPGPFASVRREALLGTGLGVQCEATVSAALGSPLVACLRVSAWPPPPPPGVSQDRLPQSLHLHLSTGSASGATSRVCSAHLRGRRARSSSQMPEVPPSEFGITFGLWGSFSLKGHRPPFTWLEPYKQGRGRCGLTAPLCSPRHRPASAAHSPAVASGSVYPVTQFLHLQEPCHQLLRL